MKTRMKITIPVLLILIAFSFYSCQRENSPGSTSVKSKDSVLQSDNYTIVGDSTSIYGKGYFKYQDSINNWHMGYSIPRDSAYKVWNLKEFERLNFLIREKPAEPGPYLDRGNHFQNINMYREAIDDYNRYIGVVPDNYSAYQNRGTAHERLRNFDSALWDYTKVIELKPRDTIAFFNRGVVYDAINNPWQAIKEYDSVIIIDSRLAKAYYNRGTSFKKIKNYEMAIRDYEKAIELNPQYREELEPLITSLKKQH
jgi:tetratricopeptide (TPR) repeat protein